MSNIKTVLRQALEALEHMCENTTARNTYNATKVADAMMGLTSALQGKEFSPAEIVFINEAWLHRRAAGLTQEEKMFMCGGTVVRLSPEQAAALTQQEQAEPVAQVVSRPERVGFGRVEDRKDVCFLADLPVGTMLYTHPPRMEWQGLRGEDVLLLARRRAPVFDGLPYVPTWIVDFYRDIEKALKERNQ